MRLAALLVLCGSLFVIQPAESGEIRPNILMIAIDDQNDWIGCLGGHPQIQTPHIDRLAERGTVFLNAHCQSPLCNPSRTSLLTGRRPSSTGIYGLSPWFRDVPQLANIVTLPQALRNAGYKAMTGGKIYHGNSGRRPADQEFDVIGPGSGIGARPEKPLVQTPSGHPLVDWGVFPHRDEDKGDYQIASWAVNQLEALPGGHDRPPFFLSVGFFLPHVPCYATQRWFDLYPEDTLQLPPFLADDRNDTPRFSWYLHWKLPEPRHRFLAETNQWNNLVRSYLACTSFVDNQVGRVLDALEKSPHAENTIVVLWSDHGWHLGEKAITGKNTLWERSTRVPLIFTGPGITPGGRCDQPAELLDIYPTLVEMCGLSPDGSLEGHSLVPQLKDSETDRGWPAITTHNHDNHGIRSRDWRYIRYADGSEELYNLREDPNEWTNRIHEPALSSVVEQHRKWIPERNEKPAPGSRDRILTYDQESKRAIWEEVEILPNSRIPEVED
ncbi:MAG: sulfatase [Planctomyces sp.]|nr:sulfatase [Planctomyces sp.]